MPVNTLKIDRAFVQDIGTDTPHQPIINAVIDMARTLHLSTVGGCRDGSAGRDSADLGCDFGQGFFYSKPVSARIARTTAGTAARTTADGHHAGACGVFRLSRAGQVPRLRTRNGVLVHLRTQSALGRRSA